MNIWIPKAKIIENQDPAVLRSEVEGLFRIQVVRPNGVVRLDTGWFPNLITDVGMTLKRTSRVEISRCEVGTGTSTPVEVATALDASIAAAGSGTVSRGARSTPPYYGFEIYNYTFDVGAVVGTIAEIGVFNSSLVMWSRALIVDGDGLPTTITLLADEQLITSYQIRGYPPNVNPDGSWTDGVDVIELSGVPYDILWRPASVTSKV